MKRVERQGINRRQFLKRVGAAAGATVLLSPLSGMISYGQMQKIVRAALWQEPEGLNPFFFIQIASRVVRKRVLEGLFRIAPDGSPVPVLAAEVPTQENGGISEDGKTITIKLRKGLVWSDGTPVTSQDVRFTWEVVMDDANPVSSRAGYELIEDISTPDDTTVVLRFKEVYAPFLTLFSVNDAVLPRHVFGGKTDLSQSSFNRAPEVGTGPFRFVRWESGAFIELEKNPNYRGAPDKPRLDKLIYTIVPARETAIQQIKTGQVDAMWNLLETQIPEFQGLPDVRLLITPSANLEYLGLNLSDPNSEDPNNPGFSDPNKPHPILGDPRVREAIELAINKQELVDALFQGLTTVAVSPISPFHWANNPELGPSEYNPEKAKQLLEEAGWTPGPGGVRVKDGVRLDLRIMTTTGDQIRLQTEQIIQRNLLDVGINLQIVNVPSAVLFSKQGPLQTGDYDIAEDTWGPDFDPADFLTILFHSKSLPPNGWNFFRINDPEIDRHIDLGNSAIGQAARRPHYQIAQKLILDTGAYIPLYNRSLIDAFHVRVKNVTPGGNPWDDFSWDAENWDV
jgi:peptide/nickel transport system substrate-binding protein